MKIKSKVNNIKLLIFINSLKTFLSHRLPIAEAAYSNNYEVTIVYGETGGIDLTKLNNYPFKFIHIPTQRGGTNPFRDLKTLFDLFIIIKKERPHIAHFVTIKPYLYGGIISRLTKVPCVVTAVSGLGTIFITKSFKHIFLRFLLYFFYKYAFNHINQKIILQNNDDLDLLVNWGVLNSSKSKLIRGSGVNLEIFKNFDEPIGLPIVCFAGRILRDKGIYEFVSAALLLQKRGLKAHFIIAGDMDTENPTGLKHHEIKNITKNNVIDFKGFQKDISKLYENSHIVCLPSYREGLPKSLIEAAAASRAVVTTDVAGCRDAIIPNKTGLLVPLRNADKLADAIQWLIENPDQRIKMGKEGRKFAEKEFSIEKIVEIHLKVYDELMTNIIINKDKK